MMHKYTVRLTYEAEVEATNIEMAIGSTRNQIERYHSSDKPHPPIIEAAVEKLTITWEGVNE